MSRYEDHPDYQICQKCLARSVEPSLEPCAGCVCAAGRAEGGADRWTPVDVDHANDYSVEELKRRLDVLTLESARLLVERDQYDAMRRKAMESWNRYREENQRLRQAQGLSVFGRMPISIEPGLPENIICMVAGGHRVYFNTTTGEFDQTQDPIHDGIVMVLVPAVRKENVDIPTVATGKKGD